MTDLLDDIKDRLMSIDPVYWVEKYLKLDGKPFRIHGNGYRPFAEMYRYVGIKALEKDAKPMVLSKSRQVGGTTFAGAMEMFFMGSGLFGTGNRPPMRMVHAFPQLDLAFSYSKVKLSAMINDSYISPDQTGGKGQKMKSHMQLQLDSSSPANDSLQFKGFNGGNHLWIESMGIDGQRLRGKTAEALIVDEVADVPIAAISNATKILTKAQYGSIGQGIQLYLGTPKQRGSAFWEMWNKSSQQYFHLGCEKCKQYFPLYTPGSNQWEEIWLYGFIVRCVHCGHEQDKRDAAERGKWIASKDPNECAFVGFHINMLLSPDFEKERVLAEKPGISTINTERSWQNEVLGEFFHGEASIITPEQIRDICGDPERKFRANISQAEDKLVFLGLDIGAKNDILQLAESDKIKIQGQSYSTAVVLSVSGVNRLSIEFATKFKRNDLASKKGLVDQIMRNYNCNLAVCDIGYANDFNELLQTEYGSRFLSSQSLPKVNNHVKFNDSVFPKIIAFEKDHWISELFDQMKKGSIRFPLGDYEKIAWLIQHCTSMEIKPTVSRTGDVSTHYVKGNQPNDGMMAMLNAYIAYKFFISNSFSIKHPALMEGSKEKKPNVLLARVPRMR